MDWPDGSRLSAEGREHLKTVRRHLDVAIDVIAGEFAERGGFRLQSHLLVEPRQLPLSDPVADSKTGIVVVQAAGVGEEDKEMFVEALKMICSEMQVYAVFTLYEAWMMTSFNGKMRISSGGRVKNMSNRKEVCVVNANFVIEYDCYSVWCFAQIDRSSGKPELGPWLGNVMKAKLVGGRLRDCVPYLTPIV